MKKFNLLKKNIQADFSKISVSDLDPFHSGFTPGEHFIVIDKARKSEFLGIIDPFNSSKNNIYLLRPRSIKYLSLFKIEEYLENEISRAIQFRKTLSEISFPFCRLFFGIVEGVPGLIVDGYENCILIQCHHAFSLKYQKNIVEIYQKYFPDQKIILFDDLKNNKSLGIDSIYGHENGLRFSVSLEAAQKNGFYYDHQVNRSMLEKYLKDAMRKQRYESALDLFSYLGSWGMHTLRAGIKKCDFVDQADLKELIDKRLKLNQFEDCITHFFRQDVFKFLDLAVLEKKIYDVIVCDPPAFSKNPKNVEQAKLGYEKLFERIIQIISPGGMVAVASCTHGVSHTDLDFLFHRQVAKYSKRAQLVQMGVQSPDHPFTSGLNSGEFYIKYLLYRIQES